MAYRLASVVLAALLAPAGSPQALTPLSEEPCAFSAFVKVTAPAGLPVHAGPAADTPLLATLPSVTVVLEEREEDRLDPFTIYPEVEVVASYGDWVKIRNAQENGALLEEFAGRPARPLFKGQGWVKAESLTVKTQAKGAHAAPDAASPMAFNAVDEGFSLDFMGLQDVGTLRSCQGEWAHMEYGPLLPEFEAEFTVAPAARQNLPAGYLRGWVNHLCGLQETSCDGA